MSAAKLDKE